MAESTAIASTPLTETETASASASSITSSLSVSVQESVPESAPSSATATTALSSSPDVEKESLELANLLEGFPNLKKTENGLRIRCCFTGHEMAVTLKAVSQYVDGKKYKNYMKNPTFDLAEYEPHLKPVVTPGSGKKGRKGNEGGGGGGKNTDNHKQLYCQLTHRLINKDPIHVLKHVQGRRFLREKRKYEECLRQGIPYVGIVRSKQKNVKKHPDEDDDDEEEIDEALEKDKKFSTNPDISDSEEGDDEEEDDDLTDLYPPEDFVSDGEDGKEKGERTNSKADLTDSTDDDDDDDDNDDDGDDGEALLSEEKEKAKSSQPGFKGFPFKLPPPSKRKLTNGGSFKRKNKKTRAA